MLWLESLSVDTPKVKKPVSASGIFALTQSPLLYKKSTVINEATQPNGETMKSVGRAIGQSRCLN